MSILERLEELSALLEPSHGTFMRLAVSRIVGENACRSRSAGSGSCSGSVNNSDSSSSSGNGTRQFILTGDAANFFIEVSDSGRGGCLQVMTLRNRTQQQQKQQADDTSSSKSSKKKKKKNSRARSVSRADADAQVDTDADGDGDGEDTEGKGLAGEDGVVTTFLVRFFREEQTTSTQNDKDDRVRLSEILFVFCDDIESLEVIRSSDTCIIIASL